VEYPEISIGGGAREVTQYIRESVNNTMENKNKNKKPKKK